MLWLRGLSIKEGNFEQFQSVFNKLAGIWLKDEDLQSIILSDGELDARYLTLSFAEQLSAAGPWGQNFPEPLFDGVFTLVQQRIVGEKHLKLVVEKHGEIFDGIAFNVDIQAWPNEHAKQIHIAYRLDVNEFRGKRTVQLMVENITVVP